MFLKTPDLVTFAKYSLETPPPYMNCEKYSQWPSPKILSQYHSLEKKYIDETPPLPPTL